MTLPGWSREPLVHFLIAGGLLYALLTWGGEPVDPASRVIDVDDAVLAELSLRFERTMGRAPTDAELDAQIERYVRDEVLYREALRLGLDQGDAVVRQRMVAKMDMAASASAEAAEPGEEELRAFFEENAERYGGEVRLSFEQEYFYDEEQARTFLARLEGDKDAVTFPGKSLISLPSQMTDAPLAEIEARFGSAFAQAMSQLGEGEDWQGPLQSGFGWHLVRVTDRSLTAADFKTLRVQIENDWRSAEIAERKQRGYQILRDAYRVNIDR